MATVGVKGLRILCKMSQQHCSMTGLTGLVVGALCPQCSDLHPQCEPCYLAGARSVSGNENVTRSQAGARIVDRTAKNCRGHVT